MQVYILNIIRKKTALKKNFENSNREKDCFINTKRSVLQSFTKGLFQKGREGLYCTDICKRTVQ